jgi:hypothetical protein
MQQMVSFNAVQHGVARVRKIGEIEAVWHGSWYRVRKALILDDRVRFCSRNRVFVIGSGVVGN